MTVVLESSILSGTGAADRMTMSRLHAPTLHTLPTAVAANARRIREATDARIMAVVKADGYGLGAITVARTAVASGATWLGVTDAAEAAPLRQAGIDVPILAWLNPSGVDVARALADEVDIAVGSVDELRQLVADAGAEHAVAPESARAVAASPLRVHLQMDTGMSRGGCPLDDWAELFRVARAARGRGLVEVVGVMGHLPLADDAEPRANAPAVLRMRHARDAALRAGFGPLVVHLAATSGALTDRATHFDMVRVGAGLVGIDPSDTVRLSGAARLTASVVHSSIVSSGTSVGYGGSFIADRTMRLSVVGVGYADGIPRELAGGAAVAIDGRRCPIVGQVSMDQIIVDTGAVEVPRGALATVFGPEGESVPSVRDWAEWAGSIPHTILTGIGRRVQRGTA